MGVLRRQPRVRGGGGSVFLMLAALALGILVILQLLGALPSFASRTTDRSQPPVIVSIQKLAKFRAARGSFEVVLDFDRTNGDIPDWLAGDRTIMVAAGDVDAEVDFSSLAEGQIEVSEGRHSVVVHLPKPTLTTARLDHDRTYVASRDRGILTRLNDALESNPIDDQTVYSAAEDKLEKAAADANLIASAETSTTDMLTGLLGGLGYTKVTVVYDLPPAKGTVPSPATVPPS